MKFKILNDHSLKNAMDILKKECDGRIIDIDVEHYINADNQDMFLVKAKIE